MPDRLLGKKMLLRLEQLLNASLPTVFSVLGKESSVRPLHAKNALSPMVSSPFRNVTVWRAVQFLKQFTPMLVTEAGMSMDSSAVLENASAPR